LYCIETHITDDGLRQFAKLPSLYTLRINACQEISDRGLEFLSKARSLERLSIADTRLTGEGFRAFSPDSSLRWICAENITVNDAGLAAISRLKNLEVLVANGAKRVTDDGLAHLAEMKSLQALGLRGTKITTIGVRHLARAESIERLDLRDTRVDDDALEHLSQIKTLRELCVRNTLMSDQATNELESSIPKLVVMNAPGMDEVFISLSEDLGDDIDHAEKK
jgi:repressor of nif and glnA expression